MKIFTVDDIRSCNPCYEPARHYTSPHVTHEWSGTALDLLKLDHISLHDRIWVISQPGFLDKKILMSFIDYCGGGATPMEAAGKQVSEKINNVENIKQKQTLIKQTEDQQLQKLIELINNG